MKKKRQKNAKNRKTLCKLYILDVHRTPLTIYGYIRLGWDHICKNGIKLKKNPIMLLIIENMIMQ